MLAYLWVAYPFTLFVLSSNTNDSLVALLLVLALLACARRRRGAWSRRLAGLTKFAPLALAPLLLRGAGPLRRAARALRSCLRARVRRAVVVAMLPVVLHGNLAPFWHDSIAYQATARAVLDLGPVGRARRRASTSCRAPRSALASSSRSCPRPARP